MLVPKPHIVKKFYLPPFTLVSPTSDRISKLKEKIEGIQISMEKEKSTQFEQVNGRILALEDKVKQTVDSRNSAFGSLSHDVNYFQFLEFHVLLAEQDRTVFS